MSGSEPRPRFVIDDVRSWPVLVGIAVVAAGWLALRWPWGEGVSILDLVAAAILVGTVIQIGVGSRRIEIDSEEIRVYRHGRLGRSRRVEDLRTISSVLGIQSLVFSDGSRLIWSFRGPEATAALDHLVERVSERTTAPGMARSTVPGTGPAKLTLHIARIVFPAERCVRCGGRSDRTRPIVAKRGFNLGFVSFATLREFAVPVCTRCDWQRRVAGWAIQGGAVAAATAGAVAVIDGDAGFLLFALVIVALALAFDRSAWLADRLVLGVSSGRLAVDHATVEVRFSAAELAQEVVQQSESAGKSGA